MQKEKGAEVNNGHPVSIIYENADVLVINKPAGLVVHPDGKTQEYTLADWLVEHYPEVKGVGEDVLRPGIVHRLDRETSGVMIAARTQEAFEYLKEQFKERKVHKIYHAFVYGTPKQDFGVIDKQIGKNKSDFRRWSAQPGARGTLRDAITHWKVLASGQGESLAISLLELRPETGRTHQLRVHLKAIHHPIVCDKLYARGHECALGFERLALHARELALVLPSKEEQIFVAEYPEDFENALQYDTFARNE